MSPFMNTKPLCPICHTRPIAHGGAACDICVTRLNTAITGAPVQFTDKIRFTPTPLVKELLARHQREVDEAIEARGSGEEKR